MRLRILTYNIHKAIGVDRRFAPERIAEVLTHHDADIVLLQEVDRNAPRSNHLDLASYFARELRYQFRATGMNVHLKKGGYGNATLSRFPIGRQRNIDLTIGWRKRRGAQHTQVHIPTDQGPSLVVEIFNIHLALAARIRATQLRLLLGTNDVTSLQPEHPCVIAGDMNDWPGLLKRQGFHAAGFRCATSERRRLAIRTFPSFAPATALDRVYYRGSLKLIQVERSKLAVARVASDHLPVIADFEVVV